MWHKFKKDLFSYYSKKRVNGVMGVNGFMRLDHKPKMNKVKNILDLQSRIEILVTVPGLGHGVPVCGFHTRPIWSQYKTPGSLTKRIIDHVWKWH